MRKPTALQASAPGAGEDERRRNEGIWNGAIHYINEGMNDKWRGMENYLPAPRALSSLRELEPFLVHSPVLLAQAPVP